MVPTRADDQAHDDRHGEPETKSRVRKGDARRVGIFLAEKVKVTGNRQRHHDREDEHQADQQVERAAETDGDFRRVCLAQVGQPCPQADADPRETHAEHGHHADVKRDHDGAHPEHQIAQKHQSFGCDKRDPRGEREFAPEDLRPANRKQSQHPEVAPFQRQQRKNEAAGECREDEGRHREVEKADQVTP